MKAYSRRHLLRDLGIASVSSAMGIPLIAGCKEQQKQEAQKSPIGASDLYIIFSGPWLFWTDKNTTDLTVVTSIYKKVKHEYYLLDTLNAANGGTDLNLNTPVSLVVTGATPAPQGTDLFASMKANDQGLFFNDKVTLPAKTPNTLRLTVTRPSAIVPAALMKGVGVKLDSTFTTHTKIDQWPGSLLFIYRGWTGATYTGASSKLDIQPGGGKTHWAFRIKPEMNMPSDCNNPDVWHAEDYFSQLMTVLNFPDSAQPTIKIPPCLNGVSQITVKRGDDPNVGCPEVGMKGTCDDTFRPVGFAEDNRLKTIQLVNCAPGGGVGGH
jgi:hypothetical protein